MNLEEIATSGPIGLEMYRQNWQEYLSLASECLIVPERPNFNRIRGELHAFRLAQWNWIERTKMELAQPWLDHFAEIELASFALLAAETRRQRGEFYADKWADAVQRLTRSGEIIGIKDGLAIKDMTSPA